MDHGNGLGWGRVNSNRGTTGLFLRFPLASEGKMFINQPFGVYETTAERQVTNDFAAMERNGFGLAIIQRNTPCFFRTPREVRFLLSQGLTQIVGPQSYAYSFVSYAGDLHRAGVREIAQAVNTPLRVFWPTAAAHPRQQESFFSVDQPNVTLSALTAEAGTIETRLFETAGKATRATLRLPFAPGDCTQIKLNGEKIRSLDVVGDSVTLNFRPWEIVTLSASRP